MHMGEPTCSRLQRRKQKSEEQDRELLKVSAEPLSHQCRPTKMVQI